MEKRALVSSRVGLLELLERTKFRKAGKSALEYKLGSQRAYSIVSTRGTQLKPVPPSEEKGEPSGCEITSQISY